MSHGDILGTKSGIIDPLVSKRPESNYEEEEKNIKQSTIMKLPRYIGMELLKSGEGGWGLKKHPTWSNISIVKHFGGKNHIFLGPRGPLGTPSSVRSPVRPQEKSGSAV